MPKPIKQRGPFRLGFRSISLEAEFVSNLLNPLVYLGKIWLNPNHYSDIAHAQNYSAADHAHECQPPLETARYRTKLHRREPGSANAVTDTRTAWRHWMALARLCREWSFGLMEKRKITGEPDDFEIGGRQVQANRFA